MRLASILLHAVVSVLFVGTAVANPLKEESSMSVDVTERLACDGSHFIVSVQRTDDVKEDSGELIAEKVSNIVFDFKVDRVAESLLINGFALKLVPQRIRNLSLLAAVIPADHPALSSEQNPPASLSVKSPDVVEALNKLERNGMVTADVDLFITYEGDIRYLAIQVQVVQVEGQMVKSIDTLTAIISTPHPPPSPPYHGYYQDHPTDPNTLPDAPTCSGSSLKCLFTNWFNVLSTYIERPCRRRAKSQHHSDSGHPHHFRHPRHGFMRFIIHVIIPVLIGAAAGVGIGILSVLVAEIIGGVIMRIRGRTREYAEVKNGEELPCYEEIPAAPKYTDEKTVDT